MLDLQPLWDWFRVCMSNRHQPHHLLRRVRPRALSSTASSTSVQLLAICLVCERPRSASSAPGSRARACACCGSSQGFIQFFRNTPPLVQLYFFYFGLGSYLLITTGTGMSVPMVSNFTWAVICLSFFAGAFNVEIFRSGIEAVPRETMEAAESLGFSRLGLRLRHPAARVSHQPAGAQQQSRQPGQDHDARLRDRRAGDALRGQPDLVGRVNVPEMMIVLLLFYVSLVGILV